jgi:DNA-binding MarR family transcriptional regulator
MKKISVEKGTPDLSKAEFEALAHFRYQLRRFLRFSEEVTRKRGVTPLQYQLMLQIKGFPGREWASVGELAERLQAKHHGVVSLISRCEAAGLVTRRLSRGDLRLVEVELTSKGEKVLQKLAQLHRAEHLSLGKLSSPDLGAIRPK